ncbi:autotransporter-associated beta strand repeat-containing protein [Lysobacter sp. A286]
MADRTKQIQRTRGSRTLSKSLLCTALAAVLAAGVPSVTHAEDRYWDANGTAVGSGGSGTWNLSNLNWSPNGDGVSGPFALPWSNALLDNAIFGGTAGTVNLGDPIAVQNLNFNTAGYVLTGGTLTLGGASPTITTAGSATINSIIAGTSGLTKAGAGTLQLSGANTYSGGISLLGGTLYGVTDGALGAAGNDITTAAGTTVGLRIDGAGTARSITIGDGGTLTVSGAGVGSALISGNGRVNVAPSNNALSIVQLTNDANSYTGATIFNGCNGVCSAYFTSIADLGLASSLGAPTTVVDGTIVFNQASQYSDNVIYVGDGDSSNRNWDINGGAAQIRNRGTGTLTITGDVDVSAGAAFNAEGADIELLGVLSGANYNFIANPGRTVTLAGANTFSGTASIGGLVRASVLADVGSASSLGMGTSINLSNGILSYTGGGSSSNRTWGVNGANSILNDGSGALALSGGLAFNPGNPAIDTLTLGGSFAGNNSFSGIISGNGNLVSAGLGTWSLDGANTFIGSVTVNNGVLRAGNASAFGEATGFTVNGGTLDLNSFDLIAPSIAGTGGSIALGSATLTVKATTAQSYAGSIAGSGGLTKSGAGTLTLTGASTYSGATTINGGRLALDFTGAGGPANNILSASSPLVLSGGVLDVLGAAGENNSQAFNGLTVNAGSNTVRAIAGAGGSVDLSLGAITRAGGLVNFVLPTAGAISTTNADGLLGGWATIAGTDYAKVVGGDIVAFDETDYTDKDDAGTWLTGEIISDTEGLADSPFFGTVGGDVALGGLRYTAAADSTVTIGAGNTLGVDGTIIVAPSVADNDQTITGGSLTSGIGGGALGLQQNGEGTFTIGSTIVDNTGVTSFAKGGAGLAVLTGANTYTGTTTLTDGTLRVGSIGNGGVASNIGASTAASSNLVLEGGTLQYGGATATTDRGFTLVNGSPSRTIEVSNGATDLTFTGQVTSPDDAGFIKTGAGTLTLANAANDYVGVTTVTGGTLAATTLTDGGVASSIGAASNDPANIVLAGGTLAYTGATTGSNRGMTFGAGGGGIGVTDAASTLTLSGVLTGTSLRKTGAGTLVLGGANTYANGTSINEGILRAGSENVFGSGGMSVAAGTLLDLDNFNNAVTTLNGAGDIDLGSATLTVNSGGTFTGTISGSGGLTRSGTNQFTLTLDGCNNTYTGTTTITNGTTLATDCLADGGAASGIGASSNAPSSLVLSNGILNYTGGTAITDRGFTVAGTGAMRVNSAATTLEFTGDILGPGGLRKDGPGTLVLSGVNSSTGNARVTGGILRAGSTTALGSGALTLDNAAGVLLDLDGFDNSVGFLAGGGANGGDIELDGATLTINAGNSYANANYAGAITGSGDLVKNGGSIQQLSGCSSSYDGVTTINGGTIAVACLDDGGANSSIGSSSAAASNLVLNGGTLQYIGAGGSTDRQFTLGPSATSGLDASGAGAIAFTDTSAISFSTPNTAQALTLGGTSTGDNTLAARITDNGTGVTRLSKTGAGTWILTNSASDYTGITTISGGVLGVDKFSDGGVASSIGASSADAANLVIGNGSTLRYTGSGDTTNRLFTLSSGVTFIESSGTGAIVFTDTGPVTLQGNNQARTIALGGTNTGLNTLAGSIGNAGTGVTTLAKNDSGTWVLTGNHSYTGSTNVNGGMLFIGNGGTTGSVASATINNFGMLGFNRSDAITYGGSIVGTGSLLQAGTGTTVLTGSSSYSGGTTIDAGTLQLGDGGATGSIVGDVVNDGALVFNRNNNYTFDGVISGGGAVAQDGSGTTILTGTNSYAGGTTINAGTLQISNDANLGAAAGELTFDGGTLRATADIASGRDVTLTGAGTVLTDAGTTFELGGTASGAGALTKSAAGTLVLTADNDYSGGTTIAGGTLQLGTGGTSGWILGDVVNNGTLVFDRSDDVTFAGLVSGSGGMIQNGSGVVTLTADNNYGGATVLNTGTLLVNGDQAAATGLTTVNTGATLGGFGVIGGDVVVNNGGTLSPGDSAGTLTIGGNLSLSTGSVLDFEFGEANVVGGPLNDLVEVGGNLVLDGTINVSVPTGGDFGGGIYRAFNYGGTLADNGLNLGTLPAGAEVTVQTSVAGQVNLVNSAGLELNFWDGDAGPKFNDMVDGGAGTWHLGGTDNNWTGLDGSINAGYADGSFAVFAGVGDSVTIDNGDGAVTASGLQFASDGYVITGDALTLAEAESVIRVGDGTATGAGFIATIAAELAGNAGLVKTDFGTLVLTDTNTYSGGTRINGGTLQLGDGGTSGSILGDVVNDGTLAFNRSDDAIFDGIISGSGGVVKQGGGVVTLAGANGYLGGTTIEGGTLRISSDANLGAASGGLTFDGGTLNTTSDITSARAAALAGAGTILTDAGTTFELGGTISGAGNLVKTGLGTLILTGSNTYAGGTTIDAGGQLQLGNGGTSGSITGDVANDGTLAFNRSDAMAFDGTISGDGAVVKQGDGVLTLTAINGYLGGTTIEDGTLRISSDANLGAVTGGLTFDGGMLNTTADIASGRDVTLADTGTILTDADTSFELGGTISGAGDLTKAGLGTLILTGTNTYAGGTTINAGTLQMSNDANLGAAAGGLTFDSGTLRSTADIASGRDVTLTGAGTVLTDAGTTFELDGTVSGAGAFTKSGAGTLVLTADNDYAGGTTIAGGTLQLGAGGTSGWILGDVANNGMLVFNRSDDTTFAGLVSGTGTMVKQGGNILTLTADNDYSGGTTIAGGTLQLGAGGTSGWILGDVANNGTLVFDRSDDVTFAGLVSGSGGMIQNGSGVVTLTADNSYGGATVLNTGTLLVNGDQAAATGLTTVNSGATLGGFGVLGGDVVVNNGGTLSPGDSVGTLTIGGNLSLSTGSVLDFEFGEANVVGGPLNDLVEVGGNLALDGTINVSVSAGGDFGGGIHRVFNYGGMLADNGLNLGTLPAGAEVTVQTSVAGQVNLVNSAGLELNFWDGDAGPKFNDMVDGGAGTWHLGGTDNNWTGLDGSINAGYADGSFAVFAGVGDSVTIDNGDGAVTASGLQFASDGYVITGDALTLAEAESVIRVGDGTEAGAGYTTTIAAELVGDGVQLVKTDLGTLVLTGENTYSDGTRISGGTLQLGDGGASGSILGDVVNDGTLAFNRSDDVSFDGIISGSGGVVKQGGGVVTLAGANGYLGGTTIEGGTLRISSDANLGAAEGGLTFDGGTLNTTADITSGRDAVLVGAGTILTDAGTTFELGGTISGAGGLAKTGLGTLVLTGTNTYAGGTAIAAGGQLQIGNGGATGSITGDVANDGTLAFNRSDDLAFDGTISGDGAVVKQGGGVLTLTAINGYLGGTTIADGTLRISSDANLGAVTGGLTFDGGTLNTTADISSGRGAVLADAGTILTDADTSFEVGGTISGAGDLTKAGIGALVLTADNDYAGGTTIAGGTLQLGTGGTSGWILGDVANNGTLVFNRSDDVTFAGLVSGTGTVVKQGGNILTLTADNDYSGGTTIAGGTLQLGAGGTSGWILGDVANDGTLEFDRSDDATFTGLVSGSGVVVQNGSGVVTLTADNSYGGATVLNAGTLLVNGDQSAATGATTASGGTTLGGAGIIGGDVAIASGASINPGLAGATPGVLTINGDLSLASGAMLNYDFGESDVVGGAFNDLIDVGGDLVLGGTLDVATSAGGSFGPGIYRVLNYGGALSGPGLTLGTLPSGTDFYVQTSVAHEVNLINTSGLALRFWDGAAGGRNDGTITGGDGIWQNTAGNDNWTTDDGSINAPFLDSAFAIFQGTGGTVTVDDSLGAINVTGMQFAADGYEIEGDRIDLVGSQAILRVGDGTDQGSDYTTTIAAELAGSAQLVKSDAGTLVLSGANSYAGGTLIDGGTLQISNDANLGVVAGGLGFDGGTLHTTADVASGRDVVLTGAGGTDVDADTSLVLSGALSGAGGFSKLGDGTLVLSGAGSNSGGMSVDAGTLLLNGNYAAATGPTNVLLGATLGGTGTIGGDVTLADGAVLTPGAGGPGTLTIDGNLSLASGSLLAFEFGEANVAGGALNDLVNVGGDLVLDGMIDVSVPAGGDFGAGVYRVFNYGGSLTNNGLELGTLPDGSNAAVQTSITGQVNLVNSAGLTLNFWDGAAGPKNDSVINGGGGVWQNSAGNDNWTNATGAVNAPYTDDAFAVFGGTGGTVEVDNGLGAVSASGMQFAADGYTIVGDDIALAGLEATIRVGDGTTVGSGYTATIDSVLDGEARLVKTDAGTLVLTADNGYAGGTLISGGTLQIASDTNLGAAAGNVTLGGGTLATSADLTSARGIELAGNGTIATATDTTFTFGGLFSGSGTLSKAGAGTLLVTGDNDSFAGMAAVTAGTLDVQGSLGGELNVQTNGRLQGTGRVGSITNAGVVAPGSSIGTLTVAGDYVGSGGTLEIEAALGDDLSATDRLVVNGATSGDTLVTVINRGGLGAQTVEGIKIVDVAGASNGAFALDGDYVFQGEQAVIAGAFGYRLYKNGVAEPGDGDWYLRSSLLDGSSPGDPDTDTLYQPGVPVYEGYSQTLLALSNLSTLQQRVGNRFWGVELVGAGVGIWGRVESSNQRPEPISSTSGADRNIDSRQIQMGIDALVSEREDGSVLIGGVSVHDGRADASVTSIFGNGSIDTHAHGLGATLTWYGPQGFYLDAQTKLSWFASDLNSATLGNLVKSNNGKGEAVSVEVGKRYAVSDELALTPQFQAIYAHVDFDRYADPAGAIVSADKGSSLKTRGGVSLDHQTSWSSASGDVRRTHLYGLANLTYEWRDGTGVDVSGTSIGSRDRRMWGELGLGGSYNWGRGAYTIYTEISADTPIADFGNAYGFKGTIGIRASF